MGSSSEGEVVGLPGRSVAGVANRWAAHHGLTDGLDRVDWIFLRLNLLFLLLVSFLPFPTRLVAEAIEKTTAWQRMTAVGYGFTLLLIRLLFAALSAYVRRAHLRGPGVDNPDLLEARKKFRFAVVGYVITIFLSLLIPMVAIGLYFAISVVMIVPFRAVRVAFGRR